MDATIGMFLEWLLRTSWQGAVLAGIVFLFQWILLERLNAQWRYALWLLVLARLLLPISPRSSVSHFNFARLDHGGRGIESVAHIRTVLPSNGIQTSAAIAPAKEFSEGAGRLRAVTDWKPTLPPQEATISIGTASTAPGRSRNGGAWFRRENLANVAGMIWAIGVVWFGLRVIGKNIAFIHHLRTRKEIMDAQTIEIFAQCKSLLGIHFRIELIETSLVKSPALHGFFRPCLLLPEQMIGAFSQKELHYIFLHELAHVKRRDMAVHWVATALKILHWFNPVLCLAFWRIAADRELACDELALSHAGEQASKHYGEAIVKVLETCAPSRGLPWVMGILEDKNQMVRRISMILKFKQRSQRPVLAVVLLFVLGLLTLTDARSEPKAKPAGSPRIRAPRTNKAVGGRVVSGPAGIVLLPGGKPAIGVGVLLICADDEQKGRLDEKSKLIISPGRIKERLRKTDIDGRFSFAPESGMQFLAAASPDGFKTIPVESLKTNSKIVLEPYGRIRGTLQRASGPGKEEDLDLAFADNSPTARIHLPNHTVTDDQGHFEFDQVPPGSLRISYREYTPTNHVRSWIDKSLQQVTLKPAQTLEVNIMAPDREATFGFEKGVRMREAALQPGVQLHGQVLLPNGKPAGGAQVALKVNSKYLLALGKATLTGGGQQFGLMVDANPNGEFTLPMYERAEAVIAVNQEGFAGVSLEDFKASSKIKLQPWGRIEGTLHIGHRVAANEFVELSECAFGNGFLPDDLKAFEVKTDSRGHFEMAFVPPGKRKLSRLVLLDNGVQHYQSLGEPVIVPGETKSLDLGGNGQRIIGKLKFENADSDVNWHSMLGYISKRPLKTPREAIGKTTSEERIAYQRTEDYRARMRVIMKDYYSYPLIISADGSFVCDEVPPGIYEVSAHELMIKPMDFAKLGRPNYYWHREVSVPEAVNKGSDEPVDLNTIELKLETFKSQ